MSFTSLTEHCVINYSKLIFVIRQTNKKRSTKISLNLFITIRKTQVLRSLKPEKRPLSEKPLFRAKRPSLLHALRLSFHIIL